MKKFLYLILLLVSVTSCYKEQFNENKNINERYSETISRANLIFVYDVYVHNVADNIEVCITNRVLKKDKHELKDTDYSEIYLTYNTIEKFVDDISNINNRIINSSNFEYVFQSVPTKVTNISLTDINDITFHFNEGLQIGITYNILEEICNGHLL